MRKIKSIEKRFITFKNVKLQSYTYNHSRTLHTWLLHPSRLTNIITHAFPANKNHTSSLIKSLTSIHTHTFPLKIFHTTPNKSHSSL